MIDASLVDALISKLEDKAIALQQAPSTKSFGDWMMTLLQDFHAGEIRPEGIRAAMARAGYPPLQPETFETVTIETASPEPNKLYLFQTDCGCVPSNRLCFGTNAEAARYLDWLNGSQAGQPNEGLDRMRIPGDVDYHYLNGQDATIFNLELELSQLGLGRISTPTPAPIGVNEQSYQMPEPEFWLFWREGSDNPEFAIGTALEAQAYLDNLNLLEIWPPYQMRVLSSAEFRRLIGVWNKLPPLVAIPTPWYAPVNETKPPIVIKNLTEELANLTPAPAMQPPVETGVERQAELAELYDQPIIYLFWRDDDENSARLGIGTHILAVRYCQYLNEQTKKTDCPQYQMRYISVQEYGSIWMAQGKALDAARELEQQAKGWSWLTLPQRSPTHPIDLKSELAKLFPDETV
jgi:hypothetical protein